MSPGQRFRGLSEARAIEWDSAWVEPCPNPTGRILTIGGKEFAEGCRRQTCPACCRWIWLRTVGAIEQANPTWFITLTLAGTVSYVDGLPYWPGDDWQQLRGRVNELNRNLRTLIKDPNPLWEWAAVWVVEQNPDHSGRTHLHLLARGAIRKEQILANATRLGFGSATYMEKRRGGGPAYILKAPLGPDGNLADMAEETLAAHLSLNGNRLVHATRNFWRDRNGDPTDLGKAREEQGIDSWTVPGPSTPPSALARPVQKTPGPIAERIRHNRITTRPHALHGT